MLTFSITDHRSRLDWLQLIAIFALMGFGIAFVFSATASHESSVVPWYNQLWVRQVFWCVVGLSAMIVICCVDYHILARWSYVAYWGTILLLILVFIIGPVRFGARRWIDLGPLDRKSTRLNSSHVAISYAVFCLKKKMNRTEASASALPPPQNTFPLTVCTVNSRSVMLVAPSLVKGHTALHLPEIL